MDRAERRLSLTAPYAGRSTREAWRVGGRNEDGVRPPPAAVPRRRPPREGEVSRAMSARPVQLQPLQTAVRPPVFEDLHKRNRPRTIRPVAGGARRKLAFVVVITRRAFLEELLPQDGQRLDGLHPIVFGVLLRLDGPHLPLAARLHDIGDMLALFVEHMREVGGEARLRIADDEAVRKSARMEAVEGRYAFLPLLGQRNPAASIQFIAGTPRVAGPDFKTRGIDQAIDFIFLAVGDDAAFGDPFHAFARRIHQRDVRAVEGLQIFVVEARPLAELVVIWFQRV